MINGVKKLLSIGGDAICPPREVGAGVPSVLRGLLSERNGFYAFESALHVFPSGGDALNLGAEAWNSPGLWRDEYGELAEGYWFFAEDIFGVQFCLRDGRIGAFDPETAGFEPLAETVDAWAELLLAEYERLTGFLLAHEWQSQNGPLGPGLRLVPKTPFFCGGEFNVQNLVAMDAVKGMRVRGHIARQIRDLPDGSRIRFVVTE